MPVEGYENYAVSDMGIIKRLEHTTIFKKFCPLPNVQTEIELKIHYKERFVKPMMSGGNKKTLPKGRYHYVSLTDNNGKQQRLAVHRLVANAFVPNPLGKPQVDHINRDYLDNRAENLRWVTMEENNENRDFS